MHRSLRLPLRSKKRKPTKEFFQCNNSEKQPAFELGQIVATPGALAALKKAGQQPGEFLTRHVNREWGDLSDEDRKENDYSLQHGFPALERLPHTSWRQVVDYHGIGPLPW